MYRFNGIDTPYGVYDVEEIYDGSGHYSPENYKVEVKNSYTDELCGIMENTSLNEFTFEGEEETEIDYEKLSSAIVAAVDSFQNL